MKKINFFGLYDNAITGCVSTQIFYLLEQGRTTKTDTSLLQQARTEIAELKQALKSSQQQLQGAQQQIESLLQTNINLRQKSLKLSQKFSQALYCAHHDELTGLPNRTILFDRIKQAMAQADRQQKQVALIFIDLDKFKSINDNLGHAAGDQLLRHVAERLSACIRCGDTACRYGGDEFLILLSEIDDAGSIAAVSEKIRSCLADIYVLDGHPVSVTASIGVAVYRNDGQNYTDLIKQADRAMYSAKVYRTFDQVS